MSNIVLPDGIDLSDGLQVFCHVVADSFCRVLATFEFRSCDLFVKFNVSVGDVGNDFRCHFRHFLAVLALESVGHEPFSYELFGKLFLFFAFAESFFVAVSVIVT